MRLASSHFSYITVTRVGDLFPRILNLQNVIVQTSNLTYNILGLSFSFRTMVYLKENIFFHRSLDLVFVLWRRRGCLSRPCAKLLAYFDANQTHFMRTGFLKTSLSDSLVSGLKNTKIYSNIANFKKESKFPYFHISVDLS